MMPVCEEVSTVFTMTSRCFFFFLSRKSQRKTESWKSYSTGKSLDFSLWYVGLRYLMWGKLEAIEQNTWIETAEIHWDDFGFLCLNQSNVTQGVCWNFRFGGGGLKSCTCTFVSGSFLFRTFVFAFFLFYRHWKILLYPLWNFEKNKRIYIWNSLTHSHHGNLTSHGLFTKMEKKS